MTQFLLDIHGVFHIRVYTEFDGNHGLCEQGKRQSERLNFVGINTNGPQPTAPTCVWCASGTYVHGRFAK